MTIDTMIADTAAGPIGPALNRLNRHGLIAGATGTGKTVTLQTLAEMASKAGVPVLAVDVKGDLSGMANGMALPVLFWDVFGQRGHPLRTTVSQLGPLLLSRLFNLSAAQAGMLDIAFRIADENHLILDDLKDLRAVLNFMSENAAEIGRQLGLVSGASVAAVQRAILGLENQGGAAFFGQPEIQLSHLMQKDSRGYGVVSLIEADGLIRSPLLYGTVLIWLLAELFETLPEAGDLSQPKLMLMIDEAHLLFNDAPPVLVEKIEQAVRLIRSKGVGVYFITQNPQDIPASVLGQLGNRIQHALRAFTPQDQKAVRVAAETFRPNPAINTAQAITELGVGEALVSFLLPDGTPMPVERAKIRLPAGKLGMLDQAAFASAFGISPLRGYYEAAVDRVSAAEQLTPAAPAQMPGTQAPGNGWQMAASSAKAAPAPRAPAARRTDSITETLLKSAARTATSTVTRNVANQLMRGLMGTLFR